MSYKEQLKEILNKFNTLRDTAKKRIEETIKSQKYSEEYKTKLIGEIKNETKDIQGQLTKEALEIIQNVKSQMLGEKTETKTEVKKDQDFDLKLSNTLKILEMAGVDMEVDELKVLVQPFEKDYHTMQILRTIFKKGGIKGINEIFGYDVRDPRIKYLDELERTISHAFFGDIDRCDTLAVSIALNYMEEV